MVAPDAVNVVAVPLQMVLSMLAVTTGEVVTVTTNPADVTVPHEFDTTTS